MKLPPFWVIKKLFYLCDSECPYFIENGHGTAIIGLYTVSFIINNDGKIFDISID